MANLRLSIIIPFYHVEKYIAQCLDSVYAQDIPESEYEVICVNDCSPDNSRDIVLEYQKKHANLYLIEHEKNKMLGAARNTGLMAARGKYVWFIDSDDYIRENVLGKLLKWTEENDLEILSFNSQRVTDDGVISDRDNTFPFDTKRITGQDYLAIEFPYWYKQVEAWGKIFSLNFLKKNNLFFAENVFFEDVVLYLKSLLLASRFMSRAEKIYFYRMNNHSIMSNIAESGAKLTDIVRYCCACIELMGKYKSTPFYNEIKEIYLSYVRDICFTNVLCLSLKEKLLYYKRIRTFDRSILTQSMPFQKHFVCTHPILIFPFTVLRPLRQLKRKYFTPTFHD
jgi:glycosyltransferase involved in cell wall biosynthesis